MLQDNTGIFTFLKNNSLMSLTSVDSRGYTISGKYKLFSKMRGYGDVDAEYELELKIPISFPKGIPIVKEIGNKIPRDGCYHINPGTDTLCLGSAIRVQKIIFDNPTITGFMEKCVAHFLTAATIKIRNPNDDNVFKGLAHGERGLLDDYKEIFSVPSDIQVLKMLELLTFKKRIANKHRCPCGCNLRVGKCQKHKLLNELRKINTKSWFKKIFYELKDFPKPNIDYKYNKKVIEKMLKNSKI